jgi:hypothetical protein
MTSEKICEILDFYEKKLDTYHFSKSKKADLDTLNPTVDEALDHIRIMIDQMRPFIKEGRIDKTFRWLGFIQGVLWAKGIQSINDLRNTSRPD